MARLAEEIGEVAREVAHHYGGKKKRESEPTGDIEEEIGDIVYTLICFANKNGYDVDRAIRNSLVECITYNSLSPLATLAKLFQKTGSFAGLVNAHYCHGIDSPTDITIEIELGIVFRILTYLARETGGTIDGAIRKSIDKVVVRDKDRFPNGI
jgi:NTP pyrophosphatase (non-canonical NTP hydrolase)